MLKPEALLLFMALTAIPVPDSTDSTKLLNPLKNFPKADLKSIYYNICDEITRNMLT